MRFETFERSLELIASLRPLAERLQTQDRSLADQIRRAATSVSLNLSEGNKRAGKDRIHLWRIAAGSAAEVRAALRVACEWKYLDGADCAPSLELVDRVLAMTWRLTH